MPNGVSTMMTAKEPSAIVTMRELVATLQGEIARMGPSKVGTRWHTDRVREIDGLQTGITMRLRKLAEMN